MAIKPCSPNAGANPFASQVALDAGKNICEECDGAAQQATGINFFPEAAELDIQPIEFVEHFQKVSR